MKFFDKKSAVQAFYYLMAIDGEITEDELVEFGDICRDFEMVSLNDSQSEIIEECVAQIAKASGDEDYYDILQEGADEAINSSNIYERISTRLVVWNLLSVAFSDGKLGDSERKYIRHIVRVTEMDQSVFMEMEQLVKTIMDVNREIEWLGSSDKPYSEIKPLMNELENRQKILAENAKNLIEDEIIVEAIKPQETFGEWIDKTSTQISETTVEVISAAGETKSKIGESTKVFMEEKVAPVAGDAVKNTTKFVRGVLDRLKPKED